MHLSNSSFLLTVYSAKLSALHCFPQNPFLPLQSDATRDWIDLFYTTGGACYCLLQRIISVIKVPWQQDATRWWSSKVRSPQEGLHPAGSILILMHKNNYLCLITGVAAARRWKTILHPARSLHCLFSALSKQNNTLSVCLHVDAAIFWKH